MYKLHHSPGRTAIIDEKEYLFFSGYSYLGMSHVPEFVSLVKEGIEMYGLLYPSSRISNTKLGVFEEMEALLSNLTLQEETVLYSSGFLAGKAVVDWLTNQTTKNCCIASGTHPVLKNNFATPLAADWQQDFLQIISESNQEDFVLLCDSVNPLKSSVNNFAFLKQVPLNKRLTCIIDDSHGIGLLGEDGAGISLHLPKLANVEYILTYSLSKAFHINGGAVSCSKQIAASLKLSSFYTASTSMAPSLCHAFINGQDLYQIQRKKLMNNINLLLRISITHGFAMHAQLPIMLLDSQYNQDYFGPHRILISSFSYPDPLGRKINRVVVNALHTEEDIKALDEILKVASQ